MVSLRQPDGDVQVETAEAIKFIWWTGDIGNDLMGISYQTEFPNSLSSLRSYMDKVAGRRACSQKKTSLGMSRSCSSLSLLQYATVMFLSCHGPVLVIWFLREKAQTYTHSSPHSPSPMECWTFNWSCPADSQLDGLWRHRLCLC